MLEKVISELDSAGEMTDADLCARRSGRRAARRLYMKYGFADRRDGGLNPQASRR